MKFVFRALLAASSVGCYCMTSAFVAPATTTITKMNGAASASSAQTGSSTLLMAGLTLYGSQGSRSPLVNWGAKEVDVTITMAKNMQENPHPFKQIPCLVDDNDVLVFESGAILQYIYSVSSASKTDSPKRQAAITSWISWANASLDPICFLETPDGKVYDTGLKQPNRRIDTLETLLSTREYLVKGDGNGNGNDDGFSLADVAVASYLLYVPQFFPDVNLSRWPNVVRYMKRCAERDGYGAAFGPQVQNMLVTKLDQMMTGLKKKLFGMF